MFKLENLFNKKEVTKVSKDAIVIALASLSMFAESCKQLTNHSSEKTPTQTETEAKDYAKNFYKDYDSIKGDKDLKVEIPNKGFLVFYKYGDGYLLNARINQDTIFNLDGTISEIHGTENFLNDVDGDGKIDIFQTNTFVRKPGGNIEPAVNMQNEIRIDRRNSGISPERESDFDAASKLYPEYIKVLKDKLSSEHPPSVSL